MSFLREPGAVSEAPCELLEVSLDCRLIVDEPADGAWNMAVDEALLDSVADGGEATLRLYRWARPTLSLGYFQSYEDRALHPVSRELPCVRRSSGGGALVHDRELTYSLALPATIARRYESRSLYCEAHRAVIDAIVERGGARERLTLCGASDRPKASSPEPFLCFQRRADGDLLVTPPEPGEADHKIAGSAQRKRRGAVLQHGGLLLGGSPYAPELPGVDELLGIAAGPDDWAATVGRNLLQRLDLRGIPGGLTDAETAAAKRFCDEKHRNEAWRRRR